MCINAYISKNNFIPVNPDKIHSEFFYMVWYRMLEIFYLQVTLVMQITIGLSTS